MLHSEGNYTFTSLLLPSGLVTTWKAGLINPTQSSIHSPCVKSQTYLVYMQNKHLTGLFLGGISPSGLVLANQEWFYLWGRAANFQGNYCLSIWIPSEEWNQTRALIIIIFIARLQPEAHSDEDMTMDFYGTRSFLGQALCRQSSKDSRVTPRENMSIVWPRA